jgi:class 3 adenylate cyclase
MDMNYDKLSADYWKEQVERVTQILQKVGEREDVVSQGRQVPEDDTLAIGTGKRLMMAVLFLDISGFSARFSETKEEQELLLNVFNLMFTELVRIAEDYGGSVEKNTGDGLMAYFEDWTGDPPEEGTKRAVAAALTMFYAQTMLVNPILVNSGIEAIQFRIGIDHGPVTIAEVGAPKRFHSRVAIGTVANIAAKALRHAAPDDIVLGYRAFNTLPLVWQREFAHLLTSNSGWLFRLSGAPYPYYKYTGRWKSPL